MVTQWLALALSLLLCLRSADFMPAAGMLRSFDRCSFAELQEHFEAMVWPETSANMCPIRSPFCFSFSAPCQMLCLQRSPAADVVLIAMLGEDRAGALGWLELARCAGLLAGAVSRRRRYMMCCARTMDLANRHRQTIEARYMALCLSGLLCLRTLLRKQKLWCMPLELNVRCLRTHVGTQPL